MLSTAGAHARSRRARRATANASHGCDVGHGHVDARDAARLRRANRLRARGADPRRRARHRARPCPRAVRSIVMSVPFAASM